MGTVLQEAAFSCTVAHGTEAKDGARRSVRRQPSLLSGWIANRILNTDLSENVRRSYIALLNEALGHPNASENVREDSADLLNFRCENNFS